MSLFGRGILHSFRGLAVLVFIVMRFHCGGDYPAGRVFPVSESFYYVLFLCCGFLLVFVFMLVCFVIDVVS